MQTRTDPPLHVPVGIPFEDVGMTDDEPPDSRTFRFFATAMDLAPLAAMPNWISYPDVDRAQAANPSIETPDAEDVVETSSIWSAPGSMIDITGDAPPMAIDCAHTLEGIEVDTSTWPAGNYTLWGYTFEPSQNIWSRRHGVVVVHDEGDPIPPAVAISFPRSEVDISREGGVVVEGCVAANGPVWLELFVADAPALADHGDAAWMLWHEATHDSQEFAVPFLPTGEHVYQALFFKAKVSDENGIYESYTREPAVVWPGCEPLEGGSRTLPDACEAGPPPDPYAGRRAVDCDAQPAEGATGGVDDPRVDPAAARDEHEDSAPSEPGSPPGCSVTGPGPQPLLLAVIVLAGVHRRPRRTRA